MSTSTPNPAVAIVDAMQAQTNGAALGTGILILLGKAEALLGKIPSYLSEYVVGLQQGLFGGYPTTKDIAPSALFLAIFIVFFFAHLFVFIKNYTRGHKFWISLGLAGYALMRWIGFAMRVRWSKNITLVKLGIASEVFLILPTILLNTLNLIMAQRIFTWRHPVGGASKLFWNLMLTVYALVIAIILMTIVASVVPYVYLLSAKHYEMCRNVVKVSDIFVLLYALLSTSLIALAYVFKPTQNDKNCATYQPWWIKSFSPFYYVEKNAAQEAEQSFLKRPSSQRHAIRVIASTDSHLENHVEGVSTDRGSLKHNHSIVLITITTLIIFSGAILRAITSFDEKTAAEGTNIYKPFVMYIMWGGLETVVNILYLIGRVDLRFYRPDVLPKEVRAIVTANQSPYESDSEEVPKASPPREEETV